MAPKTLPADFSGWDDAPPQDSTVAQRQQAARTAREARAPSWAQAFAPSTSAALASGKNPLQDATTLAAPFKDLAALPANIASGALGFLGSAPGEGGLATREAMAGAPISPYAETQNQRVVGGLALAGTALGAPFLRAVPAAVAKAAPGVAGLAARGGAFAKNAGRLVGAGVVESAPAAAYQAATGDVGGGLASLALGGALRPLSGIPKAAPAAADFVERSAGALSGVPGRELAAIGPLGGSKFGQKVSAMAAQDEPGVELSKKLADRVINFEQYLPDAQLYAKKIEALPPIPVTEITAALEKSKPTTLVGETSKKSARQIDELISDINAMADANGNITGTQARAIKQTLDHEVGNAFAQQSPTQYVAAAKSGRHEIAQAMKAAAKRSGDIDMIQMTEDYEKRLSALDKITDHLGDDPKTIRSRAEGFVSNLYGANKSARREDVAEISDIMGEAFLEDARALSVAKRAMPGGGLAWYPTHNSGRSTLGLQTASTVTNLGLGNPLGAALSAGIAVPTYAMSSPALATLGIAGSRSLANLATGNMESKAGRLASSALRRGSLASLASLRAYLQAENAQQ